MRRLVKYLFAATVLVASSMVAQPVPPRPVPTTPKVTGTGSQAEATMTVSATVVGNVDLIIIRNMDYELTGLSPRDITLDPQSDSRAGMMKIVGTANSIVRVTYERETVLRHEGEASPLYFLYNVSGGPSIVQSESSLLTQNNQVKLSDQGIYYLWVGGRISNVENIIAGNYDMELTVELEYVQ